MSSDLSSLGLKRLPVELFRAAALSRLSLHTSPTSVAKSWLGLGDVVLPQDSLPKCVSSANCSTLTRCFEFEVM